MRIGSETWGNKERAAETLHQRASNQTASTDDAVSVINSRVE
jgi:hypothetical protein